MQVNLKTMDVLLCVLKQTLSNQCKIQPYIKRFLNVDIISFQLKILENAEYRQNYS